MTRRQGATRTRELVANRDQAWTVSEPVRAEHPVRPLRRPRQRRRHAAHTLASAGSASSASTCSSKKRLLARHRVPFEEVDVGTPEACYRLRELTGRTSVPPASVDGQAIAGYETLAALLRSGRLDSGAALLPVAASGAITER